MQTKEFITRYKQRKYPPSDHKNIVIHSFQLSIENEASSPIPKSHPTHSDKFA